MRFDYPVSLVDAAAATSRLDTPVVEFRSEDDQIAGEYSPAPEKSVEEFLADFSRMGTQPEVVGFPVVYSDKNAEILVPSVTQLDRYEAAPTDPIFGVNRHAQPTRRRQLVRFSPALRSWQVH